jgi:hypothetical protein
VKFYLKFPNILSNFNGSITKAYPFVQARKDLASKYLERMSKRIRERFVRDHIQYDIKWGMRVRLPNEMKNLVNAFHLEKTPASLGYWVLDNEEEREELVKVLRKFE